MLPIQQQRSGNKSIAEFLGWRFEISDGLVIAFFNGERRWSDREDYLDYLLVIQSGFSFYSNWEKIMPVVEKIFKTKWLDPDNGQDYGFYYFVTFGMRDEETGQFMVRIAGFSLHKSDTILEALWLCLVEFCKQKC